MTKNILLDELVKFTKTSIKDIWLPVRKQEGGKLADPRPAEVYKMRLPDSTSAKKKAPYIIHQVVTGKDFQKSGNRPEASTLIRSIFCVYCEDEQEGGLHLLNLMERLRIELLKKTVIGKQFSLDLETGLETLIYTENTAPYFGGEMVSTWELPAVEREVIL